MLDLPTRGLSRSVTKHNGRLDVLCDWIEGSVLFSDTTLSKSDLAEVLEEEHYYTKGNTNNVSAISWIEDAFTTLDQRAKLLGVGCAFRIVGNSVERVRDWDEVPAHAFCLILSFARWHEGFGDTFGPDYQDQGELFERMTHESFKYLHPDWEVYPTGWSRTHANKLTPVVKAVAGKLGESIGNIKRWTKITANEAGLDLVLYRPYPDARVAVPVFLVQCASGKFEGKLHTPNQEIWERIITWASKPKKAFSTPFAFEPDEFVQTAALVNGLLLDRYRLLAPSRSRHDWLSQQLHNDLVTWLQPKVQILPTR